MVPLSERQKEFLVVCSFSSLHCSTIFIYHGVSDAYFHNAVNNNFNKINIDPTSAQFFFSNKKVSNAHNFHKY